MAKLRRTLYKLKVANLIQSWNEHSDVCATVLVIPNVKLTVCIGDDQYLISLHEIVRAYKDSQTLEFVIINDWQTITGEAEAYCKDHNITVVSYNDFRHRLHQIHEN